jgi:hypothetical protein
MGLYGNPMQAKDDDEYVEYLLDVKDGQIVSCEYYGEGRQVEPLTGPVFLMFVEDKK